MSFFFSRRKYDPNRKIFLNSPSAVMQYFDVAGRIGNTTRYNTHPSGLKWAQSAFAATPGRDILIFVHGFNTTHQFFLERLGKIRTGMRTAGFHGPVVGFDWPSAGRPLREDNITGMFQKYRRDASTAVGVSQSLGRQAIAEIYRAKPNARVHVMCHSMGSYLATHGLGAIQTTGGRLIDQALLVAADMDQDWYNIQGGASDAWGRAANRLTNYYSNEDDVLHASGQTVNAHSVRSGWGGIPGNPNNRFDDVSCRTRYLARIPSRKRTVVRSHGWYFDDPGFYSDAVSTVSRKAAANIATRQAIPGGAQELRA